MAVLITASAQPQLLLAANAGRTSATITNTANTNLHVLELTGSGGLGDRVVAPQATIALTAGYLAVVNGWWEGSPVGGASVQENQGSPLATLATPVQGSVGRVTAGGPAPGQSAKTYSGTLTLASGATTTVPLETVAAGKTLLMTDVLVTSTATGQLLFQITANGVQILAGHVNSTKGIEAVGLETQPFATSGQAVALVAPAGSGTIAYNVYGVEG